MPLQSLLEGRNDIDYWMGKIYKGLTVIQLFFFSCMFLCILFQNGMKWMIFKSLVAHGASDIFKLFFISTYSLCVGCNDSCN